jgi:hypothetical protein
VARAREQRRTEQRAGGDEPAPRLGRIGADEALRVERKKPPPPEEDACRRSAQVLDGSGADALRLGAR